MSGLDPATPQTSAELKSQFAQAAIPLPSSTPSLDVEAFPHIFQSILTYSSDNTLDTILRCSQSCFQQAIPLLYRHLKSANRRFEHFQTVTPDSSGSTASSTTADTTPGHYSMSLALRHIRSLRLGDLKGSLIGHKLPTRFIEFGSTSGDSRILHLSFVERGPESDSRGPALIERLIPSVYAAVITPTSDPALKPLGPSMSLAASLAHHLLSPGLDTLSSGVDDSRGLHHITVVGHNFYELPAALSPATLGGLGSVGGTTSFVFLPLERRDQSSQAFLRIESDPARVVDGMIRGINRWALLTSADIEIVGIENAPGPGGKLLTPELFMAGMPAGHNPPYITFRRFDEWLDEQEAGVILAAKEEREMRRRAAMNKCVAEGRLGDESKGPSYWVDPALCAEDVE
ncbi:uncharacterized protein MKK02DRAFT_28527 [Dioszegia hungarica]|uniref:Uncharacterized protein n=1 Tax=Dioszegia hungarica TaxID=4972 RepID=A0AA38H4P7_9TREE|nr:uncharacterized protein MKK02DRAFT_28527 [Dioszegia hungarica]KAI9633755.1 hypothetical protein MKK02DRAFT_28527 [Dioszegia hungarica]